MKNIFPQFFFSNFARILYGTTIVKKFFYDNTILGTTLPVNIYLASNNNKRHDIGRQLIPTYHLVDATFLWNCNIMSPDFWRLVV